jgi:hypothetical protein
MADVPAGLAWYGQTRAWAQPATLHDFYAVQVEQPTGELLLTPKNPRPPVFLGPERAVQGPGFLAATDPAPSASGERSTAACSRDNFPREFPLSVPQKLADNLYVLVNPSLPCRPAR